MLNNVILGLIFRSKLLLNLKLNFIPKIISKSDFKKFGLHESHKPRIFICKRNISGFLDLIITKKLKIILRTLIRIEYSS